MSDGTGKRGEQPGVGDPPEWAPPGGPGQPAGSSPADRPATSFPVEPGAAPYVAESGPISSPAESGAGRFPVQPAAAPFAAAPGAAPFPAGQPAPPNGWYPQPQEFPGRVTPDRSGWRRPRPAEIRWAVLVVVALALVGLGAGGLWIHLAPRLAFQVVSAGRAVRLQPEGEVFVADDAWYFFITLGIGLLAGLLAWLPRSGRGWLMPVALVVGGVAGALVTRVFGEWLTPTVTRDGLQHVGATVLFEVRLKAQAAVVTEAFAAVVAYLVLAGFAARDDLANPEPGTDRADPGPVTSPTQR